MRLREKYNEKEVEITTSQGGNNTMGQKDPPSRTKI
jgi:hypothetical protein